MKRIKAAIWHRSRKLSQCISYVLAIWVLAMVLTQLFGYEDFTKDVEALLPTSFASSGLIVAALIVIIETFALPYLLPIALSPLARWFAALCGWLVPLMWLALLFSGMQLDGQLTMPLLGSSVDMEIDVFSGCFILTLLSLMATLTTLDYRQSRA